MTDSYKLVVECMCETTHTQPFNGPLSGATRVSWHQKKHSPTHTHQEEEGFAQTTRSALSQRGLLDPITPAYNQGRLDGRLRLTASAFNWLWISMPAVLITVPTVMQNSLHPLSISSVIARHLLDFMVQGKITNQTHQPIWTPPIRTTGAGCPHFRHPPFLCQMPFAPQPSQFILARYRHLIMLTCTPSGLCETSEF